MRIGTFYREVYDYMMAHHCQEFKEMGIDFTYENRKQMPVQGSMEILISGTLRGSELNLLPNLKAVIVPYTGVEGLDIDSLRERGIKVFNTCAHAHFVAERAVALVLAVMGKVVFFHNHLHNGYWADRLADDPISWTSVYGKKIAIYGYGAIGAEIANLLSPFRGEIGTLSYKDRTYDGVKLFDSLEEMASWCDVFIVSAPLNKMTKGSINHSILELLSGKTLINIARGAIINEDDLYQAVVRKSIAGLGSDVWYTYPTHEAPDCSPSKYPFESFDNVVMTPHNAGFEENSRRVRYEDVYKRVLEIQRGDYSKAKCQ